MKITQRWPFPDDDESGKVRHDHPETAHEAAESIKDSIGKAQLHVLGILRDFPEGLTDLELKEQVEAAGFKMGDDSHRPRRIELVEKGKVKDSGQRRLNRTGRKAIVWQACE